MTGPELLRAALRRVGPRREIYARWSRMTVWRWLGGRRVPTLADAVALEQIAGIPPRAWLTSTPTAPPA